MKNKVNYLVYPNFFVIFCNGQKVKTSINFEKLGTASNFKKAHEQAEELKWGKHENKEVQRKFDSLLNK